MVKTNTIELRTFALLAVLFLLSGSNAFRYVLELEVFDKILGKDVHDLESFLFISYLTR